jgi:hypothetical protein
MRHISEYQTMTDITKYEYARMRGFRLEQLANGAIPYVHVPDDANPADTVTEDEQPSLKDIFNQEAHAGVLPFKIKRDQHTVTTYKACIDVLGNLRTVELTCFEHKPDVAADAPPPASFTVIVRPSVTVEEAIEKLNDLRGATACEDGRRATVLSTHTGAAVGRLSNDSTLWDNGIVEDHTVYFE